MYQELVKFIEEYLKKGSTKEEISSALTMAGGWTPKDIEEAFSLVNPEILKGEFNNTKY